MTNDERPTERLVAQRVRNRIMEQMLGLARGDAEVSEVGPDEWFETFFDWFPYEGEPTWYPAMTTEEQTAVRAVCKLMQLASADRAISKKQRDGRADYQQRVAHPDSTFREEGA
jgi:hypothetical protein